MKVNFREEDQRAYSRLRVLPLVRINLIRVLRSRERFYLELFFGHLERNLLSLLDDSLLSRFVGEVFVEKDAMICFYSPKSS